MSWIQLSLPVTPLQLEAVEGVLLAHGAVSISLVSDDDEPVLEPLPGETPLWQRVEIRGLLPLDVSIGVLHEQLADLDDPDLDLSALTIEFIGPDDWAAKAGQAAINAVFGGRIWLQPKDTASTAPPAGYTHNALSVLKLEPGLAFGSGSHATTRMCLDWLGFSLPEAARVLDFGCGSGILGIAAALLGARVMGVDHDEQAVMASRDNALYNGLTERQFQVLDLAAWQQRYSAQANPQKSQQDLDLLEATNKEFDVVIANILAGPLQELAAEFEHRVRPGGAIVLSGILEDQVPQVTAAYSKTRFAPPRLEEGWACLAGRTLA